MAEGVDLRDDLSRFQVIMKVPYPFLGDPLIKRKMDINATWYPYQTTKILCQMLGRSIRNEFDNANTYILDSGFNDFYKRNRKLFPEWFAESYRSISGPK
jgi:Rad3-related DNA helicase